MSSDCVLRNFMTAPRTTFCSGYHSTIHRVYNTDCDCMGLGNLALANCDGFTEACTVCVADRSLAFRMP